MIDELTSYLTDEADRVPVRDSLAEIESGVVHVPVRQRAAARWFGPALVGTAAALVVLIGVASSGSGTPPPAADVGAGGSPAVAPVAPADAAPVPTAAADALVPIPLPDGATVQGLTPSCTTRDGIEFACSVEGYRTASGYDDGGFDHTGEVQAVVSAASVVTGGCRSTSADGSTWDCALGQRAVDLELVGPGYLGEWAPIGYAAG